MTRLSKFPDRQSVVETFAVLVDHFKDARIMPLLVGEIKSTPIEELPASLVYLAAEYSIEECEKYFSLWVELVITGDYHVAFNSHTILRSFSETVTITEAESREAELQLKNALPKSGDKAGIIRDLLSMFQ